MTAPRRGLARWRTDSRPTSLLLLLVGAGALATALAGPTLLVIAGGLLDYHDVAATLKSSTLTAVGIAAAIAGALAGLGGLLRYRRMPTLVARNQAIIGGLAGLQAVLISALVLFFVRGDMKTFALNFMNFRDVWDQHGAFLTGMKNTLIIALLSTAGGITLGLLVALMAVSRHMIVRAPARVFVNVVRGTPLLVLLSLLYFGIALGLRISWTPFVAIIVGLAINAAGYSAEIFRAGLQSIDRGQLEAARGLGLSYAKTMRLVLVPQAVRRVMPPLMNEFVIVTKDTSLIVFLGVSLGQRELFAVASQGYSYYFNASFYVAAALGYLVITIPLIWIVNLAERRLRSRLVALA